MKQQGSSDEHVNIFQPMHDTSCYISRKQDGYRRHRIKHFLRFPTYLDTYLGIVPQANMASLGYQVEAHNTPPSHELSSQASRKLTQHLWSIYNTSHPHIHDTIHLLYITCSQYQYHILLLLNPFSPRNMARTIYLVIYSNGAKPAHRGGHLESAARRAVEREDDSCDRQPCHRALSGIRTQL